MGMRKVFTGIVLALAATAVCAQSYPTRPVRVLVRFPPGGGTDIMARLLTPKLAEILGQQYVVENRPGATTNIASAMVASSAPDGYTLLFTTSALAINKSLYKNLTYDAERDFAPVSMFAESPNLLVGHASAGASVKELLAQARANPGAMNYSSAGSGTSQHLAGELFKARTGAQIVHIPYKGTAASLTAVIAGGAEIVRISGAKPEYPGEEGEAPRPPRAAGRGAGDGRRETRLRRPHHQQGGARHFDPGCLRSAQASPPETDFA